MIKAKILSKYKNIKHGFFDRNGGCSKGIYKSLNCGIGSYDSKSNVVNNLKIVSKRIGCNYKNIFLLKQFHSNKFYFVKNLNNKKKLKGDALITNQKNIALAVLTADCVPILLYDKKTKVISAIHAGWRGVYKGIINEVVEFFKKIGSSPKNIVAIIGPCISEKNYEVQKEFKNKFVKKYKESKKFFKIRKNKTYFCLNKYVYYQLKILGIKNLEIINKDTFDIKNNFFSARRSIKNKDNDYGRNISIIMIN